MVVDDFVQAEIIADAGIDHLFLCHNQLEHQRIPEITCFKVK